MFATTLSPLVVVLAALLASGLGACGGDGDGADEPAVPKAAVAVVGDRQVTQAELAEEIVALRRAQPDSHAKDLEQQALSTLLAAAAVEQDAADRDIEVTKAEARRHWRVASRNAGARESLRLALGAGTEQDMLRRLRVQLLTQRVHAQISKRAGGGDHGSDAVTEFDQGFAARWRKRTVCAEGRVALLCPAD